MSSLEQNVKAQLGVGGAQVEVTPWFQQQLQAALSNPLFNVSKAFETWIIDRVAMAGLNIGIGQIIGFNAFTAQFARVSGTTTTTGDTVYHDFGTPLALTGLPDAQYVFLFGASLVAMAVDTQQGVISLGINATATDTDGVQQQLAIGSSLMGVSIRSVSSGGNNTIKLQQRVTSAGYSISTTSPWILALKYANS